MLLYCPQSSDVSESFLSSQSHEPLKSESSQSHLKFFRVESESELWLGRVRVKSRELSSHFESLLCKLESMSSHTKFQVFSTAFSCYEMVPNRNEHGSGLDRTGSGLRVILVRSGQDRTAIFFKIDGSGLDRTEKIFVVLMWLFGKYHTVQHSKRYRTFVAISICAMTWKIHFWPSFGWIRYSFMQNCHFQEFQQKKVCSRHFMVCTCMTHNSHLLRINNAK